MPEGRLFTTVEYVVLESLTKLILLWIRLDLPTLSLFALTVVTRRNVRKNSTAAALLKISLWRSYLFTLLCCFVNYFRSSPKLIFVIADCLTHLQNENWLMLIITNNSLQRLSRLSAFTLFTTSFLSASLEKIHSPCLFGFGSVKNVDFDRDTVSFTSNRISFVDCFNDVKKKSDPSTAWKLSLKLVADVSASGPQRGNRRKIHIN